MLYNVLSSWFSMITLPTYVTLVRIILIPFIVLSMIAQNWPVAAVLFLLAGITDIIDGALARSLNEVSVLGSMLDAFADKLLLISCYVSLFCIRGNFIPIPLWFIVFTIVSELLFVLTALYFVFIKKNHGIHPTKLGKLTGVGQVLFISWLFVCRATGFDSGPLFYLLLWLVVLSRLCAFIEYGVIAYSKQQRAQGH